MGYCCANSSSFHASHLSYWYAAAGVLLAFVLASGCTTTDTVRLADADEREGLNASLDADDDVVLSFADGGEIEAQRVHIRPDSITLYNTATEQNEAYATEALREVEVQSGVNTGMLIGFGSTIVGGALLVSADQSDDIGTSIGRGALGVVLGGAGIVVAVVSTAVASSNERYKIETSDAHRRPPE